MILKSFNEFVNEETSLQKAREKLLKTSDKVDKFDKKTQAAGEEIELRKGQVEYEKDKQRLKHQIETASDESTKGKAKDELKKVKSEWSSDKKKLKDRIKILRNL